MIRPLVVVVLLIGCSNDPIDLLSNDAGGDALFVTGDGGASCGGRACECSNGLDDDGDGTIDGFDVECTAAFDDDEGGFATGVPGDNRDPFCQDCFFDGNSGSGDDGCRYPTECLTTGSTSGAGGCGTCEVAPRCQESCRALTPNGCDCFGCCTVERPDGTSIDIALGDRCSLDVLDDLEACPRCIPSADCRNECGRCELCPGRTEADLPADCGGEYVCEGGTSCGTTAPCPPDAYCHQGCCLSIPI